MRLNLPASLSLYPSDRVFFCLSLPAISTKLSLLINSLWLSALVIDIWTLKIEWDLGFYKNGKAVLSYEFERKESNNGKRGEILRKYSEKLGDGDRAFKLLIFLFPRSSWISKNWSKLKWVCQRGIDSQNFQVQWKTVKFLSWRNQWGEKLTMKLTLHFHYNFNFEKNTFQ